MSLGEEWGLYEHMWHALLLEPGAAVVFRERPKEPLYVLSATEWGIVVWPLQQWKGPNVEHFKFLSPESKRHQIWETLSVTTLQNVRVLELEATHPKSALAPNADSCSRGLCLRRKTEARDGV